MTTYEQILSQLKSLPVDEQKKLFNEFTALIKPKKTYKLKHLGQNPEEQRQKNQPAIELVQQWLEKTASRKSTLEEQKEYEEIQQELSNRLI